jgi:hypothetical protein
MFFFNKTKMKTDNKSTNANFTVELVAVYLFRFIFQKLSLIL